MWNIKSPEEEKVIALAGKIQKLSDANLKLSKCLEGRKKKNNDKNEKWAWKKKAPKSGKPWTKKVNNKTYHRCKWHKAWVIHDPNATSGPNACRLRLAEESGNDSSQVNQNQEGSNAREETQVQATQALVSDLVHSLQQE